MTTETDQKPNEGQAKALDAFLDFLLDDSQKEFHLSGPAGTGKTFTMRSAIQKTFENYKQVCKALGIPVKYESIHMAATTNKAAEVLSKAIGIPAGTIHSFLGLKVQDNYSTGRTYLKRTGSWRLHQNEIIFVDECSMIDSDLDQQFQAATVNCKIIYVGDHLQLAPVMEELSPIYLRNGNFVELTEQMRNNTQPALMDLCAQFRQTVETGVFKPIKLVPGVIDHLNDDNMMAYIHENFVNNDADSRILAYTNRQVIDYNDHIREQKGLPDHYQPGEVVINNSPYHGSVLIPAEMEVEITQYNGPKTIPLPRNATMEANSYDITWGEVELKNVLMPVDFMHLKRLLRFYANEKDWPAYFQLKNNVADLRPRYASTVHKAQGSTYDSVAIDLTDLSSCTFVNQAARMFYVAVSRPRTRIFLYGNLAPKYGSLIW